MVLVMTTHRSARLIFGGLLTCLGPFGPKITNAAHKNVVLSLVERGGQVRSYHIEGSTVSQVIPIVVENVAHEAQVMTDAAMLYNRMNEDGWFASHDRVDHSQGEYARYELGRVTIHTNTVEGFFSVFKRSAAPISTARKSTCTATSLSLISATTTASPLVWTTSSGPPRRSLASRARG